jgi:hypothetical protein
MRQTGEHVETELRKAAAKDKVDLTRPENAYVVGKKARGYWVLHRFKDFELALRDGVALVAHGNTDVYVLDSRGVRFSVLQVLR